MASLEQQLREIPNGQSRKIRGITVERDQDAFLIEDEPGSFPIAEAVGFLSEIKKKRKRGIDYTSIALVLVDPKKQPVAYRVKNRTEHAQILQKAKRRKCYIYFADVAVDEEGHSHAIQPWVIDWESVDNIHGPPENLGKDLKSIKTASKLCCPFCGKKCTSTSGLTLHLKAKHK